MNKPTGLVYLSGPMGGYEGYNFNAFTEAAADLRSRGLVVFNPAETTPLPFGEAPPTREYYMRIDIAEVLKADCVVALPGWAQSEGACLELEIARQIGIPVFTYTSMGLRPRKLHFVGPVVAWTKAYTNPLVWDNQNKVVTHKDETVLQEAERLVGGARTEAYGPPSEDFRRTGRIWGAILKLGRDITPQEVAMCLIGVKLSREVNKPKRDNRVDMAGYAACLDMCYPEEG